MTVLCRRLCVAFTVLSLYKFASLTASAQMQISPTLQQLGAAYSSIPPLLIQANAVIGHGAAAKTAAATITVSAGGNVLLHLDTGNGVLDENYTVVNGVGSCTITSTIPNSGVTPPGLCGTIGPWFFPYVAMSAIDASRFQVSDVGPTQGSLSFSVIRPVTAFSKAALHNGASVLFFGLDDLLKQYVYSSLASSRAGFYNQCSVSYSDYRDYSGIVLPFRLQQYIEGNLLIDLTVANIVTEAQ